MSRRRFPFNLHDTICEQILPRNIEREDEEKFFTFIKENQFNVILVLDGWSEVDEIIQGRKTVFGYVPLWLQRLG